MNDILRSYRRVKARPPSDLRRKVLLKNFLREQMSSAPTQSTLLASNENLQPVVVQKSLETESVDVENIETDNAENSLNDSQESHSKSNSTLIFDFSKITELKLSQLTHVKKKSTPLTDADVKRISKAYTNDVKKEDVNGSTQKKPHAIRICMGRISNDKMNELTKILKNAPSNKEKEKKGISKAKHVLKSIRNPFKRIQESGKSLKDKIASKIRKCDESLKHDASQTKTIDSAEDEDLKNFTFVSEGIKYNIQIKSEYDLLKPQNKGMEVENCDEKANINKSIEKISRKYLLFSENNKKHAATLSSVSNSSKKNVDSGCTLEKKLRYSYRCERLMNKGKNKQSFLKHSGKGTLDEDYMVSQKKRKFCEDDKSQSIQTDISWSLHEIKKLERANKRLREENKLLSESLSSIMADVDVAYSPYQKQTISDSYTDSNRFKNISNRSREDVELFRISNEPMRSKVSRSRSVQERAERRREVKLRLSSRSMCHRPYSRISPKSTYRAKPCLITSCASKELPSYQPNSHVLKSLPEHNCNVTLNRKSSMPERVPPRPVLRRRLSCAPEIQGPSIRRNLLSLPTEAFY